MPRRSCFRRRGHPGGHLAGRPAVLLGLRRQLNVRVAPHAVGEAAVDVLVGVGAEQRGQGERTA